MQNHLLKLRRRFYRLRRKIHIIFYKQKNPQIEMIKDFQPNEQIQVSQLSAGFELIHYTKGLEHKWINVLNNSNEFGFWDKNRLSKIMLNSLLPNGGVIVLDKKGNPIACSAVCKKENDNLPVLMFVTVLPGFRGMKISTTMVAECLIICHNLGFPGVSLLTDYYRLPAIKIYLKLGFQPHIRSNYEKKRWVKILKQIEC